MLDYIHTQDKDVDGVRGCLYDEREGERVINNLGLSFNLFRHMFLSSSLSGCTHLDEAPGFVLCVCECVAHRPV